MIHLSKRMITVTSNVKLTAILKWDVERLEEFTPGFDLRIMSAIVSGTPIGSICVRMPYSAEHGQRRVSVVDGRRRVAAIQYSMYTANAVDAVCYDGIKDELVTPVSRSMRDCVYIRDLVTRQGYTASRDRLTCAGLPTGHIASLRRIHDAIQTCVVPVTEILSSSFHAVEAARDALNFDRERLNVERLNV